MRGDGCVACAVSDEVINGYFVIVLRLQEWTIELDCYGGGREVFCLDRVGRSLSAIAQCLDDIASLHASVAKDRSGKGFAQGDARENHGGEQGCAGCGAVDLNGRHRGVSWRLTEKGSCSITNSINPVFLELSGYGNHQAQFASLFRHWTGETFKVADELSIQKRLIFVALLCAIPGGKYDDDITFKIHRFMSRYYPAIPLMIDVLSRDGKFHCGWSLTIEFSAFKSTNRTP